MGDSDDMHLMNVLRTALKVVTGRTETHNKKYDRIFDSLRKGDIAIDCGANIGHYTEVMARKGATVHAFEPNPHAFKVLKEKFSSTKNVSCHNKAVSVENGKVPLFLHENASADQVHWSTGSSLLAIKRNVDPKRFVEIEAIDFDEFIGSLGQPIKLIKMDIEGAETKVLKKLILNGKIGIIGHLLVETHEEQIEELKPEMDEIRELIRVMALDNIDLGWV